MDPALYLRRSFSETDESRQISRTPSLTSIRERLNSRTEDSWSTIDDAEKTEDRRSKGR